MAGGAGDRPDKGAERAAREARLAEALRLNLRRRKARGAEHEAPPRADTRDEG